MHLTTEEIHAVCSAAGSPNAMARPPVSPSRAPTVPDEFPELAAMSMADLTELLCDEAKYTAFVQKQAAKTHIAQVRPMAIWPCAGTFRASDLAPQFGV